jgi:hypothetical protein
VDDGHVKHLVTLSAERSDKRDRTTVVGEQVEHLDAVPVHAPTREKYLPTSALTEGVPDWMLLPGTTNVISSKNSSMSAFERRRPQLAACHRRTHQFHAGRRDTASTASRAFAG